MLRIPQLMDQACHWYHSIEGDSGGGEYSMDWRFHVLKSFIRKAEPISLVRGIECDPHTALCDGQPSRSAFLSRHGWSSAFLNQSQQIKDLA